MNGLPESLTNLLAHPEAGRWQAALLLTRVVRKPPNWPLINHITVIDSSLVIHQADLMVRPPMFFDGALKASLADRIEGIAPDVALAILNSLFGDMEVRAPIDLSRRGYIHALEIAVGATASWSFRSDFATGNECEPIDLGPNLKIAFQTGVPRKGALEERGAAWADSLVTAWHARAAVIRAFSAFLSVGERRVERPFPALGLFGQPAKSAQ